MQHDRRHLNTDFGLGNPAERVRARARPARDGNGLKPHRDPRRRRQPLYSRCSGGYAVVAMIIGYGLVAFRDPHGIRPLVLGIRETPNGVERMVASESVALDALGFDARARHPAGRGRVHRQARLPAQPRSRKARAGYTPCIFEFVYFARPDSIIDNLSVYKARLRMGEKLADKIMRVRPDHDIDVVIPIPDTSRTAAMQVAHRLGRQVSRGLHQESLHRPHVHHAGAVARDAPRCGASSTRSGSSSTARTCCSSTTRSCAARRRSRSSTWRARPARRRSTSRRPRRRCATRTSTASTCRPPASSSRRAAPSSRCSARSAPTGSIYQDLDDLVQAVHHEKADIDGFDTSCFSGEYVTGDVSRAYLDELELIRANSAKAKRDAKVRRRGARRRHDASRRAGCDRGSLLRFLIIDDDADYRRCCATTSRWSGPMRRSTSTNRALRELIAETLALADELDVILLGHPRRARARASTLLQRLRDRPELPAGDRVRAPKRRVRRRRRAQGRSGELLSEGPKCGISGSSTRSRAEMRVGALDRRYRHLARQPQGAERRPASADCSAKLYAGDLSSVYLAEAEDTGERIAFKVLRHVPDSGGGRLFDRFLQEYEVIARVDHPNVVRIFDLGVADDHAYIAMEYLGAGSLAAASERGARSRAWRSTTRGRSAARSPQSTSAGILHRDLKPANIMFREDGTPSADRLRPREADALARGDHRHGTDLRYAVLHEPGAGSRRADGRAFRHLQPGVHSLRDADGRAAVHGQLADGRDLPARARAAPAARRVPSTHLQPILDRMFASRAARALSIRAEAARRSRDRRVAQSSCRGEAASRPT